MKKVSLSLILALSLLICEASYSQTKQPAESVAAPRPVFRVVHLYNVNAEAVAQALIPFTKYNLAIVSPSAELRAITLSGSEETVNAMESMIGELDVPPPEPMAPAIFEITVDFIYLTSGASQKPEDQREPIPDRLNAVVRELSYNFHYRNYQLMDSIVLVNTEQQGGSSSGSTGFSGVPVEYRMTFAKSSLIEDKYKTVRLSDLKMSLKYQYYVKDDAQGGKGHAENRETSFNTNLDVRPGQQMVFGKSGFMGNAIIAVISVKIIGR
jgi:type II secretory pathway component GspD/PulD (secretin)